MNKALIFISIIVLAATAAQSALGAGSCAGALSTATDKCKDNSANVDTSSCTAPVSFDPTAGASDQSTCAGKLINQDFVSRCQKPAADCLKACASDTTKKAKCQGFQDKVDQAGKQSEADKEANKQANQSGQQSGGGMPQMPSPSPSPSESPSPAPSPVAAPSASSVECSVDPTSAACLKTASDTATNPPAGASFDPSSSGGSSSSNTSALPTFDGSSQQPQASNGAAGGGTPPGGGGGGMGLGGGNNNQQKEMTPQQYADAAKNITDVLNGERGGGGGGAGGAGGFSGYGTGADGMNLSSYLPGGSKDPNRKPAGAEKKNANPDIASMHENIFGMITKRIQILCKLREIRDCDN